RLRKRQKEHLIGDLLIIQPAVEALNVTLGFGLAARYLAGDLRQLGVLGADNPADQSRKCVDMPFAMAVGPRRQRLQQRSFYGTIAPMGVTHGWPLLAVRWYETSGRAYHK